jgi:hypothetical protein
MQCTKEAYRFFIVTMARNVFQPTDIHCYLTHAWGDTAPSLPTVYRHFHEEGESFKDKSRTGRPSTSVTQENVSAVQFLLGEDRHMTVDELADIVGISHGSVYAILTEHLHL